MKSFLFLFLGAALALLTGCAALGPAPEPLTTSVQLQTTEGTVIGMASPKDTSWDSLKANRQTGEIEILNFRTNASDPTAAYTSVIAAQSQIAAEQSRLISTLIGQMLQYAPIPGPSAPLPPPAD